MFTISGENHSSKKSCWSSDRVGSSPSVPKIIERQMTIFKKLLVIMVILPIFIFFFRQCSLTSEILVSDLKEFNTLFKDQVTILDVDTIKRSNETFLIIRYRVKNKQ